MSASAPQPGAADDDSASKHREAAPLSKNEAAQQRLLEKNPDFAQVAHVCRQGLAGWARPSIWKLMMGFYPTAQSHWESIEATSESDYAAIVDGSCQLDEGGDPILDDATGLSIDADVPRTMPTLNFFLEPDTPTASGTGRRKACTFSRPQRSLRRIMCTVAAVNKGFGYVQGMSQLVGQLMVAFCDGKKERLTRGVEADVFFCFQTLLSYLGDDFCRTHDDSRESGVISTIRHFDNVLQFLDMEMFDHLQALDITSEHYALRWLMLLFTQEFNIADSLRVWDFLLSFGDQLRSAAFYVAAAMCFHIRDGLLSKDSLSDAMPLLLDYPPCDTNEFLRPAMRCIVKYDFSLIAKLKNASRAEIVALRQAHGLQPEETMASRFEGMVRSLFS